MKVYSAINAVQAELSKIGISKDRKNEQQNYKFRGIDDIYQAIAPLLAKNGLCILPRVLTREVVERVNARGTPLFYVTVAVEFDFVCAEDGSKHVVTTYGEAMDSADKATNKAMSAAYKYAALQAFAIPTEGDNDADATTHDVRPRDYKSEADALVAEIEAHDSPTSLAMWEQVNRPRVAELFKPAPAEFARVKAAKERLLASFQTEQEAA
jgi:hypothetical protein